MAIAFVQDDTNSGTPVTSLVVTMTAAITAGNTLVACISNESFRTTGITGGGVTWVLAKQSAFTTYAVDIWYGLNSTGVGAGASITATFGGTTSAGMNVSEWSGMPVLDALASGVTNSGTSVTPTPGSMTAQGPPTLYISAVCRNPSATVSSGPTDSFSALDVSGGAGVVPLVSCYRIDTGAPTAANPSWTLSTSVTWEDTMVAFRGAVFPVVESKTADNATGGAATGGDTAATSHAVVLPATISPGALLVVVGRVAVAGAVAVTGGGWTIVQDSSDASDDVSFWMYRDTRAGGAEDGTSITVTHGNGKMVAIAMSITGAANPAIRAPESSTVAVGTGSNPGPTAATPTGGIKPYLWIAVGLADGEHTSPPTTIPASYGASSGSGTGTGGLPATNTRAYTATRDRVIASEDPGTWTTSVAVQSGWTAWTLAIHPNADPVVPYRHPYRALAPH